MTRFSDNKRFAGYPLYPIAFLSFDVEWEVTPEDVNNPTQWIQSWARNPDAFPQQVLANWEWVQGWTTKILNHHKFDVIFPLLLFLLGSLMLGSSSAVHRLSRLDSPIEN